MSKLVDKEEIGKIFAVVGICQAVISLVGYRYRYNKAYARQSSL